MPFIGYTILYFLFLTIFFHFLHYKKYDKILAIIAFSFPFKSIYFVIDDAEYDAVTDSDYSSEEDLMMGTGCYGKPEDYLPQMAVERHIRHREKQLKRDLRKAAKRDEASKTGELCFLFGCPGKRRELSKKPKVEICKMCTARKRELNFQRFQPCNLVCFSRRVPSPALLV